MRMCGAERRHIASSGAQTHGQGGRRRGSGWVCVGWWGAAGPKVVMDRVKTPLLLEISSTPSQGEQCGVL